MIRYFLPLFAYLIGSIPTAVWLGRAVHGIDVREHGSRNAGATNTIRVLGVRMGLGVLLIDIAKGYLAVSLVRLFGVDFPTESMEASYVIGLGVLAVLGHIFPLFAGFHGGKGVATVLGVVLGVQPWAALCAFGVFALTLALTRYVSLGSILGGISYPLWQVFVFRVHVAPYLIFSVCVAILLVVTHRANIRRLVAGSETKFRPTAHGSMGGRE